MIIIFYIKEKLERAEKRYKILKMIQKMLYNGQNGGGSGGRKEK